MRTLSLLLLVGCAVESAAPTSSAPPPALPLSVTLATSPIIGAVFPVGVEGAAPGARMSLGLSARGLGAGPCPPVLRGDCLDLAEPIQLVATAMADARGRVLFDLPVPADPGLDGREVCLQVVARAPGSVGLSDAFCVTLDADSDGDGVGDDVDACPGFDDTIDADGDGRPDACQPRVLLELPIQVGDEDDLGVVQATLGFDHVLAGGQDSACTGLGPRVRVDNLSPGSATIWRRGDPAFDALQDCLTDGVDDTLVFTISRAGQEVSRLELPERDVAGADLDRIRLVVDDATFAPTLSPSGRVTVDWMIDARWQVWER